MWTEEERRSTPKKYNCELIYPNATEDQAKDKSLPLDAYIVHYKDSEGDIVMDVCRTSKKVNLFDMYYDKFKNVIDISFGYGVVNPRLWNIPAPKKGKKQ